MDFGAQQGAMGGPYGAAIGAGVGLGNYFAFQKPQYERQLQLAATTQRLNPWTHMKAEIPNKPNPLSSALGMASAGASAGQNIDQAGMQNNLNNAYLQYLNGGTPSMGGNTGGTPMGGAPGLTQAPMAPTSPGLPPGYYQSGGWYGGGG